MKKPLHALIGLMVVASVGLRAQTTFTWTGAAGDSNLLTGSNWTGGLAPTGSGTENLSFGAPGNFFANVSSNFAVNDITVTASGGFYWLGLFGSQLTLNGNVTTQAGATSQLYFNLRVVVPASDHSFAARGSDIYLYGGLSGGGNIFKTGPGMLFLAHPSPSFTGNIFLQEGSLRIFNDTPLGTGQLFMDGGTLIGGFYGSENTVMTLANALALGSSAGFGDSYSNVSLTFNGPVTIQSGVSLVAMHVSGNGLLTLNNIGQTDAGSGLVFDSGGNTLITGISTYSGPTSVAEGRVVFDAGALPASGALKASENGYLGTRDTANVQTAFLDRFDKSATSGIIGLDSLDASNPASFDGNLDLTGFDASARLGTATSVIVNGTITPQGNAYQFSGIGLMRLNSNLTGTRSVSATGRVQLTLAGSNDYTGFTYADGGGSVIFGSSASLPEETVLRSSPSGYIGVSDASGHGVSSFLSAFDQAATDGVIGFDSADVTAPWTVTQAINLSGFSSNVFIGSSTAAVLGPSVALSPVGGDYRFTGFRDGHLAVQSHLTGPGAVYVGLPPSFIASRAPLGQTFSPSVLLAGDNDYAGGTFLQSGRLIVGQTNGRVGEDPTTALGSGPVYVSASYLLGQTLGLAAQWAGLIIPNDLVFQSGSVEFDFGGDEDYTLAGAISGNTWAQKTGSSTVTISGDNTSSSVAFYLLSGGMIFTRDSAAGTGPFVFGYSGADGAPFAEFRSLEPIVYDLEGGYTRNSDGYYGSQLKLHTGTRLTIQEDYDTTFFGRIRGSGDNGIVKTGTGTLTLIAPNAYDGPTVINQGTLAVNGDYFHVNQLGSGDVTVNHGTLLLQQALISNPSLITVAEGGALRGTGAIQSDVVLRSGSTVAPGNLDSGGNGQFMTFGNLTLMGGAAMEWNLINPTNYSQMRFGSTSTLRIDSSVTPGTPFILRLVSLSASGVPGTATDFLNQSYTWVLFVGSLSTIQGYTDPSQFAVDSSHFMTDIGEGSFTFGLNSNRLELTFTPVPEPSSYALLGMGLACLAFPALHRRRQR